MSEPVDKGFVTYAIYVTLGAGLLFPWNAFITAADYFELEFPGQHTDRLITVCYLPVTLAMLLLMIHYNDRTNIALRIVGGMAGFCISMIAVPMLDAVASHQSPLSVILLFVVFVGFSDGIAQGAIFGDVALLPPKYTQAVVTGTAVSGVAVSLLRVITKAALPDTAEGLRRSAGVYFATSAFVCAVCFLLYACILPKLPFVQYHRKRSKSSLQPYIMESIPPRPAVQEHDSMASSHSKSEPHTDAQLQDQEEATTHLIDERMSSDCELAVQPTGAAIFQGDPRQRFSYMYTARAVWQPAASVCSVYTITLAIFPGFLAEDISSQQLGSWYPILLITAFNVADAAGKILPVQAQFAMQNRGLILNLCLARLLFLPAFYVAASQGFGPTVMALLTLALSLTNGYLTAVAMMVAPQGLEVEALSIVDFDPPSFRKGCALANHLRSGIIAATRIMARLL
ncbi:TPA: hypothetical protein ACH3X2_007822 [Trebouxia sp. C0005]